MVEPPNILADVFEKIFKRARYSDATWWNRQQWNLAWHGAKGEKRRLKGFTRCDLFVNFSTAKELDYLKVWSIYHKIPTEICEINLNSDHILYT